MNLKRLLSSVLVTATLLAAPLAFAATDGPKYNGPGLSAGVGATSGIEGISEADLRVVALNIVLTVLDYLALIAVIIIIIAGLRLIVSQGDEEAKEKTKKTILYVIVGLLIIFFARAIVMFVLTFFSDASGTVTVTP